VGALRCQEPRIECSRGRGTHAKLRTVECVTPTDLPPHIPTSPGIYQFLDEGGVVLYVGKAKSLKARLPSYFLAPAGLHPRTARMVSQAASVEWLELPSELDALVSEAHLIATLQPRYNVRLKDGAGYPYVVLSPPPSRVFITRGPARGLERFGPYPTVAGLGATVRLVAGALGVATCTSSTFNRSKAAKRPCLLYDIGQCSGPCADRVDARTYAHKVATLTRMLGGDGGDVLSMLEVEMLAASAARNYTHAARLRDACTGVRTLTEARVVLGAPSLVADVVAVSVEGPLASVVHMRVRAGRITNYATLEIVDRPVDLLSTSSEELLHLALTQLYAVTPPGDIPALLLVAELPQRVEQVSAFLCGRAGKSVRIVKPRSGTRRALVESALSTARGDVARQALHRASDLDERSRALLELGTVLGLENPPLRLECYDNAHLQGTHYVGSMVVFVDGLAKKSHYRTFSLTQPGNDDLAAMREVLSRRLARCAIKVGEAGYDASFSSIPDLLVIDGGPTQLGVVSGVLEELGLSARIPVVALAKRYEEIYVPGRGVPITLPSTSEARYLLQRLRDEAHRVANGTHAKKRGAAMTVSALDGVPGLGPVRRAKLEKSFRTRAALSGASIDDLIGAGLPAVVAGAVYARLH
jgi:excinuclease ABC subunit C